MRKENVVSANVGELNCRITRARAAALRASGQLLPLNAPNQPDQKRVLRANPKRTALDENNTNAPYNAGLQRKKRAVLQDVTNVCCNNSYRKCFNATKIQGKSSKQARKGHASASKVVLTTAAEVQVTQANSQKEGIQETAKVEPESEEVTCSVNLKGDATLQLNSITDDCIHYHWLANKSCAIPSQPESSTTNAGKVSFSGTSITSSDPDFIDIDSDKKDPQLCSLYAPDIYNNLRVVELVRRPYPNFMETIQRDITQSMRGILVDWLVEVSEEYKLVPDTLYLTVCLIDCFLSQNFIERQRLQLLGITCMLIASKYEEICAPRVEEFCFITDNTYIREEVLKMESQVLKYFGFQIFAPTAKTFLRRFLRAAQASYMSPSIELEFLANYLAELTLIDYGFLNFPPSIVAASAVFLARWTLDQSCHPWNPTLKHHTAYNASDLKTTVLALQDLQLNTNGCPLNAIRMKYRQQRFKSVATFSSPKLLETLF
ncbi:cyclin-A2-4 [Herrania umbratica]|uniref:Cyclin-A2-4 n=1 Tax=Herrania umbratica TaxID=108875 RepID=A0A6J1BJZ7_9ROSI|nr:cyclin-A2-4 [Herrania umbratica]XP_021298594.1 cyclin-A2-4 [Herrania umbratica]